MRIRAARRATAAIIAAAIPTSAVLAAVTFTSTAHADVDVTGHQLALTSVDAFVVDGSHHHLLFGSPSQNGVLVTDSSGSTVLTLAATASIDDISLSLDGQYAYAASSSLDKIYQLDLTALTVSHTFSLPANDCPDSVAVVSATRVAFGYGCTHGFGGLGVLNTSDSSVQTGGNGYYDPLVRTVPSTSQVVMVDRNLSEAVTGLFETSSGTPALLHDTSNQSYGLGDCEYLNDMAVSPDGTSILTACGSPYHQVEYGISDFLPVALYQTNPYPTAVAYSPDGLYAAAGMNGVYDDDVALFHHTASDTSQVYAVDWTDDETAGPTTPAAGLAFSADSTALYALAYDTTVTPHTVTLNALPLTDPGVGGGPTTPPTSTPPTTPPTATPPTTPPTTPPVVQVGSAISVNAPLTASVGHSVTVTGSLWFADGATLRGSSVTVTSVVGGVTTASTVLVDAFGHFSVPVRPGHAGTMVTTASFVGDARHKSSSAAAITKVVRAKPRLTLSVKKMHGKVYRVTAHLVGWSNGHTVKIVAGTKVITKGAVSAKGLLSGNYTRKAPIKIKASYAGDANDVPVNVSITLH